MTEDLTYDVIVVGASVAGSTTATFFARSGLKVALIERGIDPEAYKRICTHYFQPCATPTLGRLGLDKIIEDAGGLRNILEVWTEWGWIRDAEGQAESYGYNIRRETLDPLIRKMAVETEGVTYHPGWKVQDLLKEGGRVAGIEAETHDGEAISVHARLVVGADGRGSKVAKLSGLSLKSTDNNRFTYFTYFKDLPLSTNANSHYWHLGEKLAYAFVNDDRTTLLGVFLPHTELASFKRDIEGSFYKLWDEMPDGPKFRQSERCCEMRGMVKMPNLSRPVAGRGVAIVGDAALALDPIWGTGLGCAVMAAEWLHDATAPVLSRHGSDRELDAALTAYHRKHKRVLGGHALHIRDFSKVRKNRALETLLFSAGTRDPKIARAVLRYLAREISPYQLASPSNLTRATFANLTYKDCRGSIANVENPHDHHVV